MPRPHKNVAAIPATIEVIHMFDNQRLRINPDPTPWDKTTTTGAIVFIWSISDTNGRAQSRRVSGGELTHDVRVFRILGIGNK